MPQPHYLVAHSRHTPIYRGNLGQDRSFRPAGACIFYIGLPLALVTKSAAKRCFYGWKALRTITIGDNFSFTRPFVLPRGQPLRHQRTEQ